MVTAIVLFLVVHAVVVGRASERSHDSEPEDAR
jgi:hypothetical protein